MADLPDSDSGYDSDQNLDLQSNYEVEVGDCLTSPSSSYMVKKILGSGSYGKVALCQKPGNNQMVALKVLKNVDDDEHDDGQHEARILQMLQEGDSGHDHIVRYNDSFQHIGHYCHEFEKLDISLSDFLKSRPRITLQLAQIRPIIAQMASALQFLKTKGIVHCDLKPENIMMTDHVQQPLHIKLIDFGLARPVEEAMHGVLVQTLYYRAPEVIVRDAITEAIDIWSVGCIAAKMFLGRSLFFASDEYDLMRHVVRIVGQPPTHVLDSGQRTRMYFHGRQGTWMYSRKLKQQPFPLAISSLDVIYKNHLLNGKKTPSPAENQDCRLFVDLLKHMLDVNPVSRYTPEDILQHPFITMSHLQHRFPLYYSESQKIMDQVLDSSNEEEQPSTSSSTTQVCEAAEATGATQGQKYSHKRSREEEEEAPRKRVKREASTQISEGADATVETHGQRSSRKRSREEEEEMTPKRLKKEVDTSAKSQRGNDTSKDRPKEEKAALQNKSRGQTNILCWLRRCTQVFSFWRTRT